MDQIVKIGKLGKCKGLKGHIRIYTDFNLDNLKGKIILKDGIRKDLMNIEEILLSGNQYIIKFAEVSNISEAEKYVNFDIMIRSLDFKNNFPENDSLELIGFEIEDLTFGLIGTLEDIISTKAGEIFSFTYKSKEILVPNVELFIKDISNKKIYTDLKEIKQFES